MVMVILEWIESIYLILKMDTCICYPKYLLMIVLAMLTVSLFYISVLVYPFLGVRIETILCRALFFETV